MSAGWYSFERTAGLVIGGLDMACWDALGKLLKQPIYKLMGGAVRTEFDSMYFVPADHDIAVMTERAVAAVARGFKTIYYKVGIDEGRDVELVLRTREAIGPGPPPRGRCQRGAEPIHRDPHPLENAPRLSRICRATRAHA
jgi:L-alanine-DL-glutamate epimerase-like enolase superfamily enzyme